ncbi:8556_t:CDS:10 [Entrophospora sp. SA101]|nr:8556_t:CDS:10 [Entrophospora sp. SA101]
MQSQYEEIPDIVKNFIVYFHRNILENNVHELHSIYENTFNQLTEEFYPETFWPDAELIAPLVNDDQLFLTLYRELYYRHIYSKLTPTIEHRFHSYENYCDLFNYILNSDGPVNLELPNQWLWDIIDEFIYQFQTFCNYRNRLKNKTEEEIALLRDNVQAWSCYSVLNVLYSLITKSKITEQLLVSKNGGDMIEVAGEYGSRTLYKMLGYFSIIGLLRVHCLLGDYTLALKMMDNIELNKKALFARVTACHEPHRHHAKIFINDARHHILIPTLRSYLKLYTTMSIDKLATFLETDPEKLRSQLLVVKQKSRQQKWTSGTLLEGEYATTSDLDFCLKQDMIHIAESKIGRRFGDFFLRHTNKFQDILAGMGNR